MFNLLKRYITSRSEVQEETLVLICSHFSLVKARRNEILIRFDEVCKGYYFVNDGCLRLFTYNVDGNETTKVWSVVDKKVTDEQGRIKEFLDQRQQNKGIYKLTFFVKDYFASKKMESFYPFVDVVFQIQDDKHYHVPITLSAYGYSTYRGN